MVTPQPEGKVAINLNPEASEFQPSSHLANGSARLVAAANGKLEAEDGEIEDSLMTDVKKDTVVTPREKSNSATVPDAAPVSKAPAVSPQAASIMEQEQTIIPAQGTDASSTAQPGKDRPTQSTTLTPHPSVPARPETSKHMTTSALNSRTQHDLPSRPESSQSRSGDHRPPGRMSDRVSHDYQKEARYADRPPLDRPRDMPRTGSDRPAYSTPPSSSERLDVGPRPNERERFANDNSSSRMGTDDRHAAPMQGESRQSVRGERVGHNTGARVPSSNDQPSRDLVSGPPQPRDIHMPPPRSAASLQQDRSGLNPERAALIHGSQDSGRGTTSERHPQESRHAIAGDNARSLSQPQFNDRAPPTFEDRRDSRRLDDGYRNTEASSIRPRFDDSHAPTGPRMDRSGPEQSMSSNDRYREPMRPNHAAAGRPFESGHGRLNQDTGRSGRQMESQYGRLNAGHDAPSGPRMSNGNTLTSRGGRNVSGASQPLLGTQQPPHNASSIASSSAIQERHTPNGPAPRGSVRDNAQPGPRVTTQESSGPDVTGVHPDRLKAIQGLGGPSGSVNSSDRDDMNRANRQPASLATSALTPSRMPPDTHMQPSPTDRGGPAPPTGPSVNIDRGRDKRFAGLQGVLQQNGPVTMERSGQGASIRGRGGRSMPSPSGGFNPSAPDYPRPEIAPVRDDLFTGRTNGPPTANDGAQDAMYGRGMRRGPPSREEPRETDRRSFGYGSRGAPQERPPSYQDEEKAPLRDDPRERYRLDDGGPHGSARGRGRGQGQDIRGPALPPAERDLRGGPPMRRPGRDEPVMDRRSGQEADYERRGGGSGGGGNDDRRDANGSLRKRGRAGEEGPTERIMDSKRTRR